MGEVYRWRVGTTDVAGPIIGIRPIRKTLRFLKITHFALLLDSDLFEYGPDGWQRHKDEGRNPNYDWEWDDCYDGTFFGRTFVSPNDLKRKIDNDKQHTFKSKDYVVGFWDCRKFVEYCIYLIGGNDVRFFNTTSLAAKLTK